VVRPIVLAAALVAVLVSASPAQAQGGAPAPDFTQPCPALYPGDDASKERLARWMARRAAERGIPHELPVMAAIAESGLRNLRGTSYHGFFGMHDSLNRGEYRGFPRNPELQLRWFLDSASGVRQRRVAELRPDPAGDEELFGSWIADVEQPAPENRSGYQPHLDEASRLVAGKCAAPVRDDVEPPRLIARIDARQRPRASGGIVREYSGKEQHEPLPRGRVSRGVRGAHAHPRSHASSACQVAPGGAREPDHELAEAALGRLEHGRS
jgi:hypothetical protein